MARPSSTLALLSTLVLIHHCTSQLRIQRQMPTVRFEAEQPLEVEESGGPVRVCARVNLGNEETIPVTFTTVDGTAKAGIDYEALNETILFNTSSGPKGCVDVHIINRKGEEPDEEFSVMLSSPTLNQLMAMLTIRIFDDDGPSPTTPPQPPPSIEVHFRRYRLYEVEEDSVNICGIVSSGRVTENFTAMFSILDDKRTAGVGVDFLTLPNNGILSFEVDSTNACMEIFIEDVLDLVNIGIEEFALELSADAEDARVVSPNRTIIQLIDDTTSEPLPQEAIIGAAVGGSVAVLMAVVVLLIAVMCCCKHTRTRAVKIKTPGNAEVALSHLSGKTEEEEQKTERKLHDYVDLPPSQLGNEDPHKTWREVLVKFILSPSQLKVLEPLGEGAFGRVHKGLLTVSKGPDAINTQVAIKTLKNSPTQEEVNDFISESAIMLDFDHPNVMRLVGVCFDSEDGLPRIILPYMANGDLKSFLKSKRSLVEEGTSTGSVEVYPPGLHDTVLIRMCWDIAKGMEYLSRSKFVHRDLAARNCMVDEKLSICVADFGLSKDVYTSDYYRLTHDARLPVKWMAPESLYDHVYNEQTDVWSFGVVCWEVFSLGRVPFPGVDNADIPDYISRGNRLRKPTLCPNQVYDVMLATWDGTPAKRPLFTRLVSSLRTILAQEASQSYLELVLEGSTEEEQTGCDYCLAGDGVVMSSSL